MPWHIILRGTRTLPPPDFSPLRASIFIYWCNSSLLPSEDNYCHAMDCAKTQDGENEFHTIPALKEYRCEEEKENRHFFFFFWFWGFLHCGKNTSHEINPLHKLLGVKYSIVSCKIQYCYLYNTVLLAIDTVQYSGYLEFFSSYTTEICTLWLLSLYFPITSPWQPPFYSLLLWVWLF